MNTSDIDSTFKQSPIVYDTFDRNSDYAKKHQRKSSHSRFEDNPSTKSLGGVSQDHSSRLSDASQIQGNGLVKPDANEITDIKIVEDEEATRNNKRTTIYVIEYYIDGQRYITKRSYSEFRYMYKQIEKTKPELELPELPPKKPM